MHLCYKYCLVYSTKEHSSILCNVCENNIIIQKCCVHVLERERERERQRQSTMTMQNAGIKLKRTRRLAWSKKITIRN